MGLRIPQADIERWTRLGLIAPPPPPPIPDLEPGEDEAYFQSRVEKLADENGWLHYHVRNSRQGKKGFLDWTALRGPVCIIAELKVHTKPSNDQKVWLRAWEKIPGVIVRLWRPEDWAEIKHLLVHGELPKQGIIE